MKSFYETPFVNTSRENILNAMILNLMFKTTDYETWDNEEKTIFKKLRFEVMKDARRKRMHY